MMTQLTFRYSATVDWILQQLVNLEVLDDRTADTPQFSEEAN